MNSKKIIRAAVFVLAFLFLGFISAFMTMKVITWGRTVNVPDVRGRDLATAITALQKDGLEIKVDRQEYHPSVPVNAVIAQTPLPGSSVKRGRSVMVVVSMGSVEVNVPEMKGVMLRRAQMLIKQAGLALGEVCRAPSDQPSDYVVTQFPAGEAVTQKDGKVDILVSDGPSDLRFVTPDLTGKTSAEAEAALKPFAVTLSPTGNGKVITGQDPKAGYMIAYGGTLKVALGAAQPPAPAAKAPAANKAPAPAGAKP